MKAKIPKIIEAYIKASNNSDIEAFISCFSNTATVLDEGETLSGHEAIKKWFAKTRSKYQFKAEPIEIEEKEQNISLACNVYGNFPGSPLILNYHFKVSSGLIQSLSIK